jgi:hypothetical protein
MKQLMDEEKKEKIIKTFLALLISVLGSFILLFLVIATASGIIIYLVP